MNHWDEYHKYSKLYNLIGKRLDAGGMSDKGRVVLGKKRQYAFDKMGGITRDYRFDRFIENMDYLNMRNRGEEVVNERFVDERTGEVVGETIIHVRGNGDIIGCMGWELVGYNV
jgi:hypothetical protein